MSLPYDFSCEAEYADGFILSETNNEDQSAYDPIEIIDGVPTGPNTFSDILKKHPEAEHGRMVRFSVFRDNRRYDVDWTNLPDNARPIRYRDRSSYLDALGNTGVTDWHGLRFGYQYTENGKSIKEIKEI